MPLPANVSSVFGHLGKPDSEPDSDAQPSTTVRPASLPSKLPHRSLPKPSPTAQASLVGPREALLGGGCPRVNQSRATNPEDTRSKKRKAGSGPNLDGEEGDGKELGGLLLQLQRHREERERVDCARRASSEKDERSACKGTRVDVIVGRGVRPGDRDTEKLDVLEHIVEACPRGSVFEFHKYLMGVKDEEFGDFICLCAALLSVQCLDHVAMKACEKLRSGFPGGFSVQAVAASSPQELEPLINTCNYYKGKAKKIHSCACTLLRKHKGKVPQAQASLLELDGVGPKIAHLVLSVGLGVPRTGIVVDTHVRRVAGRLGWAVGTGGGRGCGPLDGPRGATAEDTRKQLEEWVPIDARVDFTLAVISHGQTVCTKERPRCADCAVKSRCPSAFTFDSKPNTVSKDFFGAAPAHQGPGVAGGDSPRVRSFNAGRSLATGGAPQHQQVIVLDQDDADQLPDDNHAPVDIEDAALPIGATRPRIPHPLPPPSSHSTPAV